METFSVLLAIFARNSLVTDEFTAQSQWRGTLMFSLIWAWINGWVNNSKASDFRRHRAYYDVTLIIRYFHTWRWRNEARTWEKNESHNFTYETLMNTYLYPAFNVSLNNADSKVVMTSLWTPHCSCNDLHGKIYSRSLFHGNAGKSQTAGTDTWYPW